MINRLEKMKECLVCAVEGEMTDLAEVDTKELGEAIDMIKDLAEAIYYITVTEAMGAWDDNQKYYTPKEHHLPEKMYYGGYENWGSYTSKEYPSKDIKEGRSPHQRRMYMETKETHSDKTQLMRELEKYAQELTSDIIEMIEDASPEEKQYLSKKITVLANKITQTND